MTLPNLPGSQRAEPAVRLEAPLLQGDLAACQGEPDELEHRDWEQAGAVGLWQSPAGSCHRGALRLP